MKLKFKNKLKTILVFTKIKIKKKKHPLLFIVFFKEKFIQNASWTLFLQLWKIEFPFKTCLFIICTCERLETQLVISSCIHIHLYICIYSNNIYWFMCRYNSPLWAMWKRTSFPWISRQRPLVSFPFSRRLTNTRLSMRVRYSNTLYLGLNFVRLTRIY